MIQSCSNCGKEANYPDNIIRELLICQNCGNHLTIAFFTMPVEAWVLMQTKLYGRKSMNLIEKYKYSVFSERAERYSKSLQLKGKEKEEVIS